MAKTAIDKKLVTPVLRKTGPVTKKAAENNGMIFRVINEIYRHRISSIRVTLNASFKQANTNIIDFEFWDVGEEAHFLQANNNMLVIGIFLNNPSSMLFIHIPVTYSEVEELFHLTKVNIGAKKC